MNTLISSNHALLHPAHPPLAGAPVSCESEHLVVIAGTTAVMLPSLFGQLHKEALMSSAELNPDPLVCNTAGL